MTICLSMICKNEAHCIEKCLNSVKPFINYWVICDDITTTDNSEEIIKECLKDIPGEYHKHKWIDISTNRNMSLELAKTKADYILVIDADDHLISKNNFNLNKSAYYINFLHGSITYKRIQLFKSNLGAKYIGVAHEYLELPIGTEIETLDNCHIIYGGNGAQSYDPEKFLKAAKIIDNALLTEPNNSRYVFYGAQSYRDAGKLQEALKLYMRRSNMGGWIEEQYMSLIEAAKIMERLNKDFSDIENIYLRAYNLHPNRVESLCHLSTLCRNKSLYEKAYFYAKIGMFIDKPNDALFLEYDCYNWKIIDECAIACYYIGKYNEGIELNKKLLESRLLPQSEVERIKSNLQFCKN